MSKVKAKVKPQPILAKVSQADAMLHFRNAAGEWQKSSIRLVLSGAVCLITALYSTEKVDYDTTVKRLKAEIAERGILQAQSYKYIGLSRYLVSHLAAKFAAAGPIVDVTKATTWDGAMGVLLMYLEKHKVRTLDDLGVLLGRYRRTATKATSPSIVPGDNVVPLPVRVDPAAIVTRIKSQPDLLTGMQPHEFARTCVVSGRSPREMVEAFIPYLTAARDCHRLSKLLLAKAEAVAKGHVSDLAKLAKVG